MGCHWGTSAAAVASPRLYSLLSVLCLSLLTLGGGRRSSHAVAGDPGAATPHCAPSRLRTVQAVHHPHPVREQGCVFAFALMQIACTLCGLLGRLVVPASAQILPRNYGFLFLQGGCIGLPWWRERASHWAVRCTCNNGCTEVEGRPQTPGKGLHRPLENGGGSKSSLRDNISPNLCTILFFLNHLQTQGLTMK